VNTYSLNDVQNQIKRFKHKHLFYIKYEHNFSGWKYDKNKFRCYLTAKRKSNKKARTIFISSVFSTTQNNSMQVVFFFCLKYVYVCCLIVMSAMYIIKVNETCTNINKT